VKRYALARLNTSTPLMSSPAADRTPESHLKAAAREPPAAIGRCECRQSSKEGQKSPKTGIQSDNWFAFAGMRQ
jgi:hypothetical protein